MKYTPPWSRSWSPRLTAKFSSFAKVCHNNMQKSLIRKKNLRKIDEFPLIIQENMKLIRKIFGKRKSFNGLINLRRNSGLSPFQPTNANLPSRDFSTIAFSPAVIHCFYYKVYGIMSTLNNGFNFSSVGSVFYAIFEFVARLTSFVSRAMLSEENQAWRKRRKFALVFVRNIHLPWANQADISTHMATSMHI